MILSGKNAVITGANRGIGKQTVEVFAKNGANIWACSRSKSEIFEKELKELSGKYNVSIYPIYFDLTKHDEIKQAMKEIISQKKSIDILVNNAGILPKNKLFQMKSIEEMKNVFEVNFFSHILITQYISRAMIRQKYGSIVNVTSTVALDGIPAQLDYVSSKAAIIGATKALAIELGQYDIRVNSVAPSFINTDLHSNTSNEFLEKVIQNNVIKRLGDSQEIAKTILFLSSELSSYMTGQVLRVDGGGSLG